MNIKCCWIRDVFISVENFNSCNKNCNNNNNNNCEVCNFII